MKLLEVAPRDKEVLEAEGDKWATYIIRDCEPWLSVLPDKVPVVYRGMSSYSRVKTVRADRKPVDTGQEAHKVADDWFFEKFGHRYRSNAMFVSREYEVGTTYGTPYVVFPMGKFKACWSPEVRDMSIKLGREAYNKMTHKDRENRTTKQDFLAANADTIVPEFLEKNNYVEGRLKQYFMDYRFQRTELMVACSKYYVLPNDVSYYAIQSIKERLNLKGEH